VGDEINTDIRPIFSRCSTRRSPTQLDARTKKKRVGSAKLAETAECGA